MPVEAGTPLEHFTIAAQGGTLALLSAPVKVAQLMVQILASWPINDTKIPHEPGSTAMAALIRSRIAPPGSAHLEGPGPGVAQGRPGLTRQCHARPRMALSWPRLVDPLEEIPPPHPGGDSMCRSHPVMGPMLRRAQAGTTAGTKQYGRLRLALHYRKEGGSSPEPRQGPEAARVTRWDDSTPTRPGERSTRRRS